MTDIAPIRRALISVSDKAGLLDLAQTLAGAGVEILSTGGTAVALRAAGIAVKDVSDHSGFPEILDGRVKTLVPQIHGGILGRRDLPAHVAQMDPHFPDWRHEGRALTRAILHSSGQLRVTATNLHVTLEPLAHRPRRRGPIPPLPAHPNMLAIAPQFRPVRCAHHAI